MSAAYVMKQIVKASEELKAKQLAQQKQATTAPARPLKNGGLTDAELAHYVGIIEKAAEGYTPPKKVSLLDQIIIQRLEAMGLTPNV